MAILDNIAKFSEPVESPEPVEDKWVCTEETDGISICTDPDLQFKVIDRRHNGEFVI